MKRIICGLLAALCLLSLTVCAGAESATYRLGDTIDDFTVTLSDGQEVRFYELLAEKDAVLINLWATWCYWCKVEFPSMQEAYNQMSDRIGVLALSAEPTDTDEMVLALREELGLDTLPLGLDRAGLSTRFDVSGYPTSILVDRNGTICYLEAGAITETAKFVQLFSVFTGDDYETTLLNEPPQDCYPGEWPESLPLPEGCTDLGQPGDDPTAWPFLPAEDGLQASNAGHPWTDSILSFEVTAEAGQALSYCCETSGESGMDLLTVLVDDKTVALYTGASNRTDCLAEFETPGTHRVSFCFRAATEASDARIRGLQLLTPEEAAAQKAAMPEYPRSLDGDEIRIRLEGCETTDVTILEAYSAQELFRMPLLSGDDYTVRISIGQTVNPDSVFLTDALGDLHPLSDLPTDGESFLYASRPAGYAEGNQLGIHQFCVYASAEELLYGDPVAYLQLLPDEAAIDTFFQLLSSSYGIPLSMLYWEPAGSGFGVYVTDEDGNPVADTVLQLCDEDTCQLLVTDENGFASVEEVLTYLEVHVLTAPEGFLVPNGCWYLSPETPSVTILLARP